MLHRSRRSVDSHMIARARGAVGALALFLVMLAAAGCTAKLSDTSVPRLDAPAVSSRTGPGGGAVILDVRPAADFESGHIPGARNLRLGDSTQAGVIAQLRGRRVIVYGENPSSAAAMAMAKRLIGEGLNAALFEGGMDAWRAAGLPVERGG